MRPAGFLCVLAVFVFASGGCHKVSSYESHYTEPSLPPASGTEFPPLPRTPLPSFSESFDGADTSPGHLGEGWDIRGQFTGAFPLPGATDGFVRNGAFTYAGDSVVRAVRHFRGALQALGAVGLWHQVRDGSVETTATMAITPNDNIISDMVQFSVNRSTWKLVTRRDNGGFDPIASGQFSPILNLDQPYTFELDVSVPGQITLKLPDDQIVTRNADITGLDGDTAFWELYPMTTPASVVFGYDKVWAAEAGVPALSAGG